MHALIGGLWMNEMYLAGLGIRLETLKAKVYLHNGNPPRNAVMLRSFPEVLP